MTSYNRDRYIANRDKVLAAQKSSYEANKPERQAAARLRHKQVMQDRGCEVLKALGTSCKKCKDALPVNMRAVYVAEAKGKATPLLTFCRKKITKDRLAKRQLICANCKE